MDLIKSLSLFDPAKLQGKRVAVIGAGATGSMTVLQLAKLGIETINVYDFDRVEPHNIPNQLIYGVDDIGELKVMALANRVNSLVGGHTVNAVEKEVKTFKMQEEYIFFCVDTMSARERIFEKAIFLNGKTELLVDMRMNARLALVFAFNPSELGAVDSYRQELYPDSEVEPLRGTCGNVLSIGPTAAITSSLAVWQFIELVNKPNNKLESLSFNINASEHWDMNHFSVCKS